MNNSQIKQDEKQQGYFITKEQGQHIIDVLGLFPAKDTYNALNILISAPVVEVTPITPDTTAEKKEQTKKPE